MSTKVNVLETNENGVKWIEVTGIDYGTSWQFEDNQIFGITEDDRILDSDGIPCTPGDRIEIAVRNAIEAAK